MSRLATGTAVGAGLLTLAVVWYAWRPRSRAHLDPAPSLASGRRRLRRAGLPAAAPYNPSAKSLQSLQRFRATQQDKPCARQATLWGSRDWDPALGLEGNVRRSVPGLLHLIEWVRWHVDRICAPQAMAMPDPWEHRDWIRRTLPRHPDKGRACVDAFVLEVWMGVA